jgi:hypothetical protein
MLSISLSTAASPVALVSFCRLSSCPHLFQYLFRRSSLAFTCFRCAIIFFCKRKAHASSTRISFCTIQCINAMRFCLCRQSSPHPVKVPMCPHALRNWPNVSAACAEFPPNTRYFSFKAHALFRDMHCRPTRVRRGFAAAALRGCGSLKMLCAACCDA